MKNPIGGFRRIRDLYITYLETAFRISDPGVSRERRELLERAGSLCTEPLVEPVPRYETIPWSISDLASEGVSDALPGFAQVEAAAFVDLALAGLLDSDPIGDGSNRRRARFNLYSHQAEMLTRGVQSGHPGIVTSGTGSGKTEAFLLPVLAKLAQEAVHWAPPADDYPGRRWWQTAAGAPVSTWGNLPSRPSQTRPEDSPFIPQRRGEHRSRPAAVRALILYPMNALVEDQMVRIRRALDSELARSTMDRVFNRNRLFFGRYTSASPVTGFHRHPRPSPDETNGELESSRSS